ncbi:MAG: FkbM family methyltransferase [Pyrinomonadaceae bacterium]
MSKLLCAGEVAFDVGVFLGLYTAFLSKMVGERGVVHSFEPNGELLPSLNRTAKSLKNVWIHPVALSDKPGEATLFVPSDDASMASLLKWTDESGSEIDQVTCKTQRLDDLVHDGKVPLPDFIKCDVEGTELSVFNGAEQTLNRKDAPIIMFEVNPKAMKANGNDADSCFRFLGALENPHYSFFEVLENRITPVSGLACLHFNAYGFTNAIAVPDSKLGKLAE